MADPGATAMDRARRLQRRIQRWAARRLPPGARLLAGLALMVGGVFGFLPVLGFWMIPLGLAVAALDVRPLCRAIRRRRRLQLVQARRRRRASGDDAPR